MASNRQDLGALLHRLRATVIEREQPILARHEIEMWDYVVLSGLERRAVPTQAQLAAAVGRDKTRLIPILDRLEGRGLVRRAPDPRDRRNRIVSLTEPGAALLAACKADIRAMEKDLLSAVDAADRAAFVRVLTALVAAEAS